MISALALPFDKLARITGMVRATGTSPIDLRSYSAHQRPAMNLKMQHLVSFTPQWKKQVVQQFQQNSGFLHFQRCIASATGRTSQKTRAIHTITTYQKDKKKDGPDQHLFCYTSGRWLWDEEEQLLDRYKAFNVSQLQTLAAQAIGSERCESIIKLAEGGFNKVFRLEMNDGKTLLARIPNPNAGPSFYTTASEVASMEFARDILQIPVPRVVGWSATSHNPVESEYILMEEARGSQLATQWDELNSEAKLAIMREVVAIETKMLSISFSHFGSIYFASDAVDGAVPAQITSVASTTLRKKVLEKYTIGPSVERNFWKKERSSMNISGGPWSSSMEYASSVGCREVEWITKCAIPKASDDITLVSTAQNNPKAHIKLLEKYLSVVPCLMDINPQLKRATLWHSDLHSSNFFIENNAITAVIDWQGLWIGPLLLQAQPSPLIDYQGSILLQRPDNFDDLDPEEQVEIKRQISKSTLLQVYLMETERFNPSLAAAFNLDHGKTRRLAIELAGNTWDDEFLSFRESLINVQKYWQELGGKDDCPYHFTEEELRDHAIDAEGWNVVQDFFNSIERLVQRDGWTHNETYDAAFDLFSDLRKLGLERRTGKERDTFDKHTSWARMQD